MELMGVKTFSPTTECAAEPCSHERHLLATTGCWIRWAQEVRHTSTTCAEEKPSFLAGVTSRTGNCRVEVDVAPSSPRRFSLLLKRRRADKQKERRHEEATGHVTVMMSTLHTSRLVGRAGRRDEPIHSSSQKSYGVSQDPRGSRACRTPTCCFPAAIESNKDPSVP